MVTKQNIKDAIEENDKYWIAFTGDSITSTEWVHPNWRDIVEYVLKDQFNDLFDDWRCANWGIRCFNFAYDGATTRDILEKAEDILKVKPNLVISLMGGNDPVFKVPINEHVANIVGIAEILNVNNAKVVWCNSTPASNMAKKNAEYEPYAGASMQIKGDDNFHLIDMFNIYKKFPLDKFFTFKSEENQAEGVKEGDPDFWHPNSLGNAYIAKVVLKEVFQIEFDPEKYIDEVNKGEKFPKY